MKVWTLARYVSLGRSIGGPEEGGWSYGEHRRDATWTFGTEQQCLNLLDAMKPHDHNEDAWYDIKEWDADGTVDDPTWPSCCYGSGSAWPQVPASVDAVFPPDLPSVNPHYC
jgi:hypothetical protein